MSIGTARRWQAKIAFMMGMYWVARSPETLTTRMRLRRLVVVEVVMPSFVWAENWPTVFVSPAEETLPVFDAVRVCLLM